MNSARLHVVTQPWIRYETDLFGSRFHSGARNKSGTSSRPSSPRKREFSASSGYRKRHWIPASARTTAFRQRLVPLIPNSGVRGARARQIKRIALQGACLQDRGSVSRRRRINLGLARCTAPDEWIPELIPQRVPSRDRQMWLLPVRGADEHACHHQPGGKRCCGALVWMQT